MIASPSPSLKIRIIGRKCCLRCKGKILLGIVIKFLKRKVCCLHLQCFTFLPQVNFPANNLNFHNLFLLYKLFFRNHFIPLCCPFTYVSLPFSLHRSLFWSSRRLKLVLHDRHLFSLDWTQSVTGRQVYLTRDAKDPTFFSFFWM